MGDDNFEFRFAATIGRSSGLLTMWDKDGFKVSKNCYNNRFVVIEGKWLQEDMEAMLINVYVSNNLSEQKNLWRLIDSRIYFISP